jgi:hypothetical protein
VIRPEPDSFAALLHELLVERYDTTDRDRPTLRAAADTPEVTAYRRQVLNEAMEDLPGNVVPIRRDRAA